MFMSFSYHPTLLIFPLDLIFLFEKFRLLKNFPHELREDNGLIIKTNIMQLR